MFFHDIIEDQFKTKPLEKIWGQIWSLMCHFHRNKTAPVPPFLSLAIRTSQLNIRSHMGLWLEKIQDISSIWTKSGIQEHIASVCVSLSSSEKCYPLCPRTSKWMTSDFTVQRCVRKSMDILNTSATHTPPELGTIINTGAIIFVATLRLCVFNSPAYAAINI